MSTDSNQVDEFVILIGGEDCLEECHQVGLLSDWEWPGIHIDALCFQDLLECVLLWVVHKLEVRDVLFNNDVGVPGGKDVGVILEVGDTDGPELVVSVMGHVLCLGPDDLKGGFMDGLTDVLGELSDRSADLYMFLSGVIVVFRNLQLLKDFT